MAKIITNSPFQASAGGVRSYSLKIGTGTSKIQALSGGDAAVDADWIDVPDSSVSASTAASMYCAPGIAYRFVLGGDTTGWISG